MRPARTTRRFWLLVAAIFQGGFLCAQQPFLSDAQWTLMRDEASGLAPYENLRSLTRLHRVPATAEFDQAAEFMLARAKEYGLQDAHAEQFPIDGKDSLRTDALVSGVACGGGTPVGASAGAYAAGRLGNGPDPAGGLQPQCGRGRGPGRRWRGNQRGGLRRARTCEGRSCWPMEGWRRCSAWR